MLLVVCGLVNLSCAISTTAVSFIAPAAEADFNLNSTTKGILNGAPFFGKSTTNVSIAGYWLICCSARSRYHHFGVRQLHLNTNIQ